MNVVLALLDVVSSLGPDQVVWIVDTITDDDDIPPDIDVIVDELVCCIVGAGVVVAGIGVSGHVRGKQLIMHTDGAVEQSCYSDVNSRHKSLECERLLTRQLASMPPCKTLIWN